MTERLYQVLRLCFSGANLQSDLGRDGTCAPPKNDSGWYFQRDDMGIYVWKTIPESALFVFDSISKAEEVFSIPIRLLVLACFLSGINFSWNHSSGEKFWLWLCLSMNWEGRN